MARSASRTCAIGLTVIAAALAVSAMSGDRVANGDQPAAAGRNAVLDSEAMKAMLRADRDKNGVLTREEVEQYDLGLARRFKEADVDRDGKLTLYELEKLITPPEQSAKKNHGPVGATR